MKKLLYGALVLGAMVACSKENDSVQSLDQLAGRTVTIRASIQAETKTAYANEKTFSWEAGDQIAVQLIKTEDGSLDQVNFTTSESGNDVSFTGTVPDGYEIADLAFYPIHNPAQTVDLTYSPSAGTLTLANTIAPDLDNPLSAVPLIGTKLDDGEYSFKTATGIVKVTLSSIPSDAAYVILYGSSNALSGSYTLDADNAISMETVSGTANGSKWIAFTPEQEDETRSFYFPIPEGTIEAGTRLYVLDASGTTIFSKAFAKDVTVVRNTITEVAQLDIPKLWEPLGTGQFGEDFAFGWFKTYQAYADVEIDQSLEDENIFRIHNPYQALWDLVGYSPAGSVTGPDPYLYLYLAKAGETKWGYTFPEDGWVYFDDYYTGYYNANFGEDAQLCWPGGWTSFQNADYLKRNRVLNYQANGLPSNVQLAPVYYWASGYWTGASYIVNDHIRIVFPDCEPLDFYVEAEFVENDETEATVDVYLTDDVEYAKVGIALTKEEAAEAAQASDAVTITTSSTVQLPLPAASGEFFVVVDGYYQDEVFESATISFQVAAATASEAYLNWIGSWTTDEGETWVFGQKANDVSLYLSGLAGTSYQLVANFDANTGAVSLHEQDDFDGNGTNFAGFLLYNNSYYYMGTGLAVFTLTPNGTDSATLTPGLINATYGNFIGYEFDDGSSYLNKVLSLPTTLTKVQESGGVAPRAKKTTAASAKEEARSFRKVGTVLPTDQQKIR